MLTDTMMQGINQRRRQLTIALAFAALGSTGCRNAGDSVDDGASTLASDTTPTTTGEATAGLDDISTSETLDEATSTSAGASEAGNTTDEDACVDFEGVTTPEQSAATPRKKIAIEKTAILFTSEPVVPDETYVRAVAESEIRSENGYTGCPSLEPNPSEIVITFDGEHKASVESGSYDAWNCPNERYGATPLVSGLVSAGGAQAIILLDGVFDTTQILADYANLPGVVSAGTVATDCSAGEFDVPAEARPGLHGCAEGTTWHYWWTDAYPGQEGFPITAGAHLQSQPGESPVVVCSWENGADPCPPPACLDLPR